MRRSFFALVLLFGLTGCGFRLYYTPSAAMAPTIPVGARVLVDEWAYRPAADAPQRGDIVVFMPPVASRSPFIKRIIALPGDGFAVRQGRVYVNGRALHEPYVTEPADYTMSVRNNHLYVAAAGTAEEPLGRRFASIPQKAAWRRPDRLPADCYILLGDNRNDSEDSHVYGCVKRAEFIGKVIQIYK